VHRLLGSVYGSGTFRHNSGNLLPFDVVVVDEASMIDMPLMARLIAALSSGCRLIMLGDPDQLASVEAGAVLGDICNPEWMDAVTPAGHSFLAKFGEVTFGHPLLAEAPPLCDAVVNLKKSYRFGPSSGIAAVSRLVNEGRGEEALLLMRKGGYPDIAWKALPSPGDLAVSLRDRLLNGYGGFLSADDPAECLAMLGTFRILSPLRKGPYGVVAINAVAESALCLRGRHPGGLLWYKHRPVLITGNDYQLRLSNGDIGVALPGGSGEELTVWFPAPDGSVRQIAPQRLSSCETVFAMTVHKSQGSEFDSLLLLFPDAVPDILTRELVYTAITRARKKVEIWGSETAFIAAVSRKVCRSSGLGERLWGLGYSGSPLEEATE
jgi:exodeoxyribonuclease V alpha subunit